MMDDLEDAMQIQWIISHGSDNVKETEDSKFLLATTNKIMCYHCDEKGHKANKCPKKKKNGGSGSSGNNQSMKFQGKFHTCGKI